MKKEILKEIIKFVEEESIKNDRGYHKEWMIHLNSVSTNALELANKLGGDKEVVFLSAWMHDIGKIMYGKEDHHITGSDIAEKKLREMNYPEEKIEMVKHCIFSHRGSKNIKKETIEAQILADSDAMAHFEEIEDLVKAEIILGGTSSESLAQQLVNEKLIRSWNKLSPEGKAFAKIKYPGFLNKLNLQ